MSAASTIGTLQRQRAAAEGRARTAERQLAAMVDELTEAQTENARLAALIVEAFDQRDAAQAARDQAAREQAEAQRDRALELLTQANDKIGAVIDLRNDMRERPVVYLPRYVVTCLNTILS